MRSWSWIARGLKMFNSAENLTWGPNSRISYNQSDPYIKACNIEGLLYAGQPS